MPGSLRGMFDKTVSLVRQSSNAQDSTGGIGTVTETTVSGMSAVKAAIWPIDSDPAMAEAFRRRDIVVSHAICFMEDIGAKATDYILHGSTKYDVRETLPFDNGFVLSHPIYVVGVLLRTV